MGRRCSQGKKTLWGCLTPPACPSPSCGAATHTQHFWVCVSARPLLEEAHCSSQQFYLSGHVVLFEVTSIQGQLPTGTTLNPDLGAEAGVKPGQLLPSPSHFSRWLAAVQSCVS